MSFSQTSREGSVICPICNAQICCLIDSWFVNDNRNFTLKLTSNISTPELWLWIHTFDNSYFVVLFLTGYLKQNSLRTNQFQTITNWLSFIEKIEKLGNKPRLWWNVHGIFFFVFWISCSFVFPCSIWGLHCVLQINLVLFTQ